jgi:alkanesulfonate monooxygenase SsuD/methylene tetrahydromethanopterin reductase-like flavin-dependent oxidoreductase (luciferase family)
MPRAASRGRPTEETGKTFRELAGELTGLPGSLEFTGTPEQFADLIERWLTEGASDGFTLQPATLPGSLELFVDHVVPIPQENTHNVRTVPGTEITRPTVWCTV